MWKHDVEKDIREMGIVNWRKIEQDRYLWRRETREVFTDFGEWNHSIITRLRDRKVAICHFHSRKGADQSPSRIYEELMQVFAENGLPNVLCKVNTKIYRVIFVIQVCKCNRYQ
jgi:hypothetical protein